jgi:hypothetical protein
MKQRLNSCTIAVAARPSSSVKITSSGTMTLTVPAENPAASPNAR